MKVSNIFVISVIIKLQREVVFRDTFGLNMKATTYPCNQSGDELGVAGRVQKH